MNVCSGEPLNSFDMEQWGTNHVKSVTVPKGRRLTMFDAENLEGPYV